MDDDGYRIDRYTDQTQLAICSMEFIYFARPDSNIYGVNVHSARKRMGARLAQESPVDADMVIAVPNSSLSAASGYSEEAGLPNEMGLIKNQYVARTFIQPTQELREQGVRMKLSAVRGVVKGKRVIVIDDSIVRGTTSKRIVQLLKEAGAAEVHMRISSPPLKYPCFYGIDISTTKELIAAKKSVDEIRDYIGADSLAFLSLDGLVESIGLGADAPYGGLCVAYFNGDYPTALDDYEADFLKSLTPEDRVRLPEFALYKSKYEGNEYTTTSSQRRTTETRERLDMPKAYEEAGVSVEAGYEVVKRIKSHVARTNRPGVVGGIGGFGGLFDLASLGYKEPVLISGTDASAPSWSLPRWPTSTTPSASTAWPCASTILPLRVRNRCSSWITSPAARTIQHCSSRLWLALPTAAYRLVPV